jgi:hypothetical protein
MVSSLELVFTTLCKGCFSPVETSWRLQGTYLSKHGTIAQGESQAEQPFGGSTHSREQLVWYLGTDISYSMIPGKELTGSTE